jgi:hypothetical protein
MWADCCVWAIHDSWVMGQRRILAERASVVLVGLQRMHAEIPENFACSGPKIRSEVFRKSHGIFSGG